MEAMVTISSLPGFGLARSAATAPLASILISWDFWFESQTIELLVEETSR
jgi:hypothetical protein